jgi:hypothetical protein
MATGPWAARTIAERPGFQFSVQRFSCTPACIGTDQDPEPEQGDGDAREASVKWLLSHYRSATATLQPNDFFNVLLSLSLYCVGGGAMRRDRSCQLRAQLLQVGGGVLSLAAHGSGSPYSAE